MIAVRIAQIALTVVGLLLATYVVAMPLLASFRRKRVRPLVRSAATPTIAVVVPAHNMEGTIGSCIEAIKTSDYPMDRVSVYVVADHCTDNTSAHAKKAGAIVLVRDEEPAGKTYALAWTLRTLSKMPIEPDLYLITDATARLDRYFLAALVPAWQAGEDIIVGHSILDLTNRKWFAKCLGLTLVHRNLQNWSRERLGLSSLIEGRGMAYSLAFIREHGWELAVPTASKAGQHPTEDWRHGVRVVEHGYRVAYADDARVFTPFRGTLAAATRQGIRWERGRQLNAITLGSRLLATAIRKRDCVILFAALDAIQLPVAILGVLCAGLAFLTLAIPGGRFLNSAGLAPLILIVFYGFLVTLRGRHDGIPATTAVWAPVYLLWRLAAFAFAWTPLDRPRTRRNRFKQ